MSSWDAPGPVACVKWAPGVAVSVGVVQSPSHALRLTRNKGDRVPALRNAAVSQMKKGAGDDSPAPFILEPTSGLEPLTC